MEDSDGIVAMALCQMGWLGVQSGSSNDPKKCTRSNNNRIETARADVNETAVASFRVENLSVDTFIAIVGHCLKEWWQRLHEEERGEQDEKDMEASSDSKLQGFVQGDKGLPDGVAARHRYCTQLSLLFKSLGYREECGYNHFLYPTTVHMRKLLLWLIEKLPKTREESFDQVLKPKDAFQAMLQDAVRKWKSQPRAWGSYRWAVAPGQNEGNSFVQYQAHAPKTCELMYPINYSSISSLGTERCEYENRCMPLVTERLPASISKQTSLLETLAKNMAREKHTDTSFESTFAQNEMMKKSMKAMLHRNFASVILKTQQDKDDRTSTESLPINTLNRFFCPVDVSNQIKRKKDEAEKDRPTSVVQEDKTHEKEVDKASIMEGKRMEWSKEERELELVIQEKIGHQARIQADLDEETERIRQVESDVSLLSLKSNALEKHYLRQKKTIDMLTNAEENIQTLKEICAKRAQTLMDLGIEWEKHRLPLLEFQRNYNRKKALKKEKCKQMTSDIKTSQSEVKEMTQKLNEKEKLEHQLDKKLAMLPMNVNRDMYLTRIMDIIRQVHKQNVEIDKIVSEIHDLHKKINSSSETLKRSEAVADEQIFKAARAAEEGQSSKHLPLITTYRYLAELRELFETLIQVIQDMGRASNEVRSLENKAKQLDARMSDAQIAQITKDLLQIQLENKQLRATIGKQNSSFEST